MDLLKHLIFNSSKSGEYYLDVFCKKQLCLCYPFWSTNTFAEFGVEVRILGVGIYFMPLQMNRIRLTKSMIFFNQIIHSDVPQHMFGGNG